MKCGAINIDGSRKYDGCLPESMCPNGQSAALTAHCAITANTATTLCTNFAAGTKPTTGPFRTAADANLKNNDDNSFKVEVGCDATKTFAATAMAAASAFALLQ